MPSAWPSCVLRPRSSVPVDRTDDWTSEEGVAVAAGEAPPLRLPLREKFAFKRLLRGFIEKPDLGRDAALRSFPNFGGLVMEAAALEPGVGGVV